MKDFKIMKTVNAALYNGNCVIVPLVVCGEYEYQVLNSHVLPHSMIEYQLSCV